MKNLKVHVAKWSKCQACRLHKTRNKVVLYRGQVPSDIVFVGEAPGANEDSEGLPFVGKSGQILDLVISELRTKHGIAMGGQKLIHTIFDGKVGGIHFDSDFPELRVAITNTLACRPPDNRKPLEDETTACSPRLQDFLYLSRPYVIVGVGRTAQEVLETQWFPNFPKKSTKNMLLLEGPNGMVVYARIYHPAYILRNGRNAIEGYILGASGLLSSALVEASKQLNHGDYNGT